MDNMEKRRSGNNANLRSYSTILLDAGNAPLEQTAETEAMVAEFSTIASLAASPAEVAARGNVSTYGQVGG